jgi:hypothetical protein
LIIIVTAGSCQGLLLQRGTTQQILREVSGSHATVAASTPEPTFSDTPRPRFLTITLGDGISGPDVRRGCRLNRHPQAGSAPGRYRLGEQEVDRFHAWGACLQQGNDPKKAYARTWGCQEAAVAAGVACGSLLVVGKDTSESPFKVRGPGSNLADHTLLGVAREPGQDQASSKQIELVPGTSVSLPLTPTSLGWYVPDGLIRPRRPRGCDARTMAVR